MNKNKFYQFVVPSVCASMVTGLYFVVDGIFVGRGIGSSGLGAINLAVPFICILTAVAMMIAMGGATITSIFIGQGNDKKAVHSFMNSIFLVLIFSGFMTVFSFLFSDRIAVFLGAEGSLLSLTSDYLRYYILFGIFFCMAMVLAAFVRNDGSPRLGLVGMAAGALSNVFLDWLFIFVLHMGIHGAAIASGLGQVISCMIMLPHFVRGKGRLKLKLLPLKKYYAVEILRRGIPELITQMSQPITIFCYNLIVIRYLGNIGVSAFSVVCYLLTLVFCIFIGVSDGIQPLISRSVGEGKKELERYFFRKGIILNFLLALFLYAVLLLFGEPIVHIFNREPALVRLASESLSVYGISFLFAAVNMIFTTYHLASKRTSRALIIASLRSFVVNVAFIFLLPSVFGRQALWTGIIAAEAAVTAVAVLMMKKPLKPQTYQATAAEN
ncbi:MATE family efflux transporter [Anaerostipes sp.]|uniref:MATE family efflux transporter n=1 Tax=Anaerostipes sp. TaxID=1872530 RepID=UPI0025BFF82E|nr:MATE family efflux transporter [Anaerostipes sp.]MBS7007954.1 MATE family efflux transporter [Anaerostipes sp.]